jgi:hypothetical protein
MSKSRVLNGHVFSMRLAAGLRAARISGAARCIAQGLVGRPSLLWKGPIHAREYFPTETAGLYVLPTETVRLFNGFIHATT